MKNISPVSVIIPFYNSEETIIDSVDSVLKQSLPPAEIVLIDDGSTDQSLALVKKYFSEEECGATQIIIESYETNRGVYPARNHALELASQPFIAFQDADDFWHQDKLKTQMPLFNDPEVHLVCGRIDIYDGIPKDRWDKESEFPEPLTLTKNWVLWRNVMVTSSVVIRMRPEFKFSVDKKRGSDMGLWLDIVLSGHKGLYTAAPVAFARKPLFGAGGLTANIRKLEEAHQKNLIEVESKGYISKPYYFVLRAWSYAKYLRRVAIVFMRRVSES